LFAHEEDDEEPKVVGSKQAEVGQKFGHSGSRQPG
jgi:hypothetical protein